MKVQADLSYEDTELLGALKELAILGIDDNHVLRRGLGSF
jgi:hypothetical protein